LAPDARGCKGSSGHHAAQQDRVPTPADSEIGADEIYERRCCGMMEVTRRALAWLLEDPKRTKYKAAKKFGVQQSTLGRAIRREVAKGLFVWPVPSEPKTRKSRKKEVVVQERLYSTGPPTEPRYGSAGPGKKPRKLRLRVRDIVPAGTPLTKGGFIDVKEILRLERLKPGYVAPPLTPLQLEVQRMAHELMEKEKAAKEAKALEDLI
jgi:hypothetical protein